STMRPMVLRARRNSAASTARFHATPLSAQCVSTTCAELQISPLVLRLERPSPTRPESLVTIDALSPQASAPLLVWQLGARAAAKHALSRMTADHVAAPHGKASTTGFSCILISARVSASDFSVVLQLAPLDLFAL